MIQGVNHLTFAVRDLAVSLRFYNEVLSFRLLATWNKGAYLLSGDVWLCLILDAETIRRPTCDHSHAAFTVLDDNFETMAERIHKSGFGMWKENTSEGKSLYFLDPDGHKLEIHVGGWKSRLEQCRQTPFSDMNFFG